MKELYLVRHGQTDFNKRGIVQGKGVDSSLNETGLEQARLFHAAYKDAGFEKIYVSTLKRTYESIRLFDRGDLPIEQNAGLDEISWGIHEGQVSGHSYTEFHRLLQRWKNGEVSARIEKGESPLEVQVRQIDFLNYLKNTPEKKILICSHGRSMRILLCTLLRQSLDHMDAYPHHNLCLYKVEWDGTSSSITQFNDMKHLGK